MKSEDQNSEHLADMHQLLIHQSYLLVVTDRTAFVAASFVLPCRQLYDTFPQTPCRRGLPPVYRCSCCRSATESSDTITMNCTAAALEQDRPTNTNRNPISGRLCQLGRKCIC